MGADSVQSEATRLAILARVGLLSASDFERLGEITLRHCRIEAAKQVRAGVVPSHDYELCAIDAAAKCFSDGLAKFDSAKAQWGTYCQRICANHAIDQARDRTRQALLKLRLFNEGADRSISGSADYSLLTPPAKIRRNPDALVDWDQQLGKWQKGGIVPSYADLEALKKRILQEYNL